MRYLCSFLAGVCLLAGPAGAADLELFFLANDGFLLRSSGQSVIIDGLLEHRVLKQYGALPADVYADALAGNAPFEGVDLLLVTHEHEDHFQATATRNFMAAQSGSHIASAPEIVKRLGGENDRIVSVLPDKGETLARTVNGVYVEFMELSHGKGRFAGIRNLAHVIHMAGYTVLHVGDAAMDAFNFTEVGLGQRRFDVAILPYWYFQSPAGQSLVRGQIHANQLIAAHVPPEEVEQVRSFLASEWPDVKLLEETLDSVSY